MAGNDGPQPLQLRWFQPRRELLRLVFLQTQMQSKKHHVWSGLPYCMGRVAPLRTGVLVSLSGQRMNWDQEKLRGIPGAVYQMMTVAWPVEIVEFQDTGRHILMLDQLQLTQLEEGRKFGVCD
ncbi:hypothetical protein NDU88_005218 [Pleurodeles waltl]|uniref:Uncharacterized protein n=1 Tax=Pleurodeles waltl TaxID=8319 RepID=A0AAV7NQV6_PLEWA|nr:hypothetical protein NDU88_005218 [Pleurodeles waltl]